ncbi:MAG: Rrf2 family transcriptional regulator [Alphaproteobacteria bacterium]|nr:Rrf2 family transcriptional regulator [Alphaproteobacteria bacterium]
MLSMKAKYAIRALMVLAANEGKMLQSKAIAKEADAPMKFLEAILLELKHHGLVESKRGIFGGYFLAVPAKEVMLGDVIRLIDGMLAPIRCASVTNYQKCEDCTDVESCTIRHMMVDVRNAIASVLDNKTLAEMVKQEAKHGKTRHKRN